MTNKEKNDSDKVTTVKSKCPGCENLHEVEIFESDLEGVSR